MKDINLTEGPIARKLILFALPMIAGNMLQQIYNLVDTMIVGKYIGAGALAAVGASYTLMVFLTSAVIGLCMGSGALFSADYGAQDKGKLREDIVLSFLFIAGVTLLLYLILLPCQREILKLLRIPSEIFSVTEEYVGVILMGIVFVVLYNFFAYLLRAMGNSLVPLLFLAASSLVNIVLDLLFVISFRQGVKGAAIATVIAQALSGVGLTLYSFRKLEILKDCLQRRNWQWNRLREIMVHDAATSVQQSVMNFGILMIQGLVNSFGTSVMAAFAAAVKIDTIAYMPAQEFGNAYSLFVSQNFGAEKRDRIGRGTRLSFLMSAGFCLMISALVWIFAGKLMTLFVDPAETEILSHGIRYLRIEGAAYVGIGMLFLWYGYFRGIAKPQISLLLTVISLGTRVVLSYTLAPHTSFGVNWIWCSIPIGWFLADVAGLCLKGREKGKAVQESRTG
ncbi:MAG: MATE family efflux transporter [Lachnospiraceae bacterium]|nr:MATE family efflux transporter [Lachnospiraceae bacterium]